VILSQYKRPSFTPMGNNGQNYTVRSEIRCTLRLRYVYLVVNIEVAAEVSCCFAVFNC
jgi:hypothetical protein